MTKESERDRFIRRLKALRVRAGVARIGQACYSASTPETIRVVEVWNSVRT
jgi:hypothetical protein